MGEENINFMFKEFQKIRGHKEKLMRASDIFSTFPKLIFYLF